MVQQSRTTPDEVSLELETRPGQITHYPADFNLAQIQRKLLDGEITFLESHRDFVWTKRQASRLIESFLADYPVPPIYAYTAGPAGTARSLLVIDGKQRLKSIFYFWQEHFEAEQSQAATEFRLTGLDPARRWHNKTYSELWPNDRETLEFRILRTIIIRPTNPETDTNSHARIIRQLLETLHLGGNPFSLEDITRHRELPERK